MFIVFISFCNADFQWQPTDFQIHTSEMRASIIVQTFCHWQGLGDSDKIDYEVLQNTQKFKIVIKTRHVGRHIF